MKILFGNPCTDKNADVYSHIDEIFSQSMLDRSETWKDCSYNDHACMAACDTLLRMSNVRSEYFYTSNETFIRWVLNLISYPEDLQISPNMDPQNLKDIKVYVTTDNGSKIVPFDEYFANKGVTGYNRYKLFLEHYKD